MTLNKVTLSFSLIFLFVCCQDLTEKKSDIINDEPIAGIKKDTVRNKNTIASPEKSILKKWNANAATAQIKFSVNGPFGTVHGSLSGLKSNILFDEDNLAASTISASVDSRSISTGIGMRNR